MGDIISNLKDPSWWFSGIFFIVLAILIAWLFKKAPRVLQAVSRNFAANRLRKIKNTRRNGWEIHYQIAADRSYFLVFSLVCLFYSVLIITTPFIQLFKTNHIYWLIIISPLYIVELIWLNKNSYVKRLIEYAKKIG